MPQFKSALLGGGKERNEDLAKSTSKPLSDIPDELPPLAEESVKPPETNVVPDDLPEISSEIEKRLFGNGRELDQLPLGPEEEEDKRLREYMASELTKGFTLDEIKDVLLKAKHPAMNVNRIIEEYNGQSISLEPQKIPVPEAASAEKLSTIEELKFSTKPGFFSNLINVVSKHDEAKEKLLSGDLFARMEQDWKIREKEHKEEIVLTSEQQLRRQMTGILEELEDLENKWQIQKSVLETESKKMADKEKAIKENIDELRKILKKLEFYKDVKPENYFRFTNGIIVKNMQELIDILKVIDEETFKYHVNTYRNDLNAWIQHAVGRADIASQTNDMKSREDLIRILEGIKELK